MGRQFGLICVLFTEVSPSQNYLRENTVGDGEMEAPELSTGRAKADDTQKLEGGRKDPPF